MNTANPLLDGSDLDAHFSGALKGGSGSPPSGGPSPLDAHFAAALKGGGTQANGLDDHFASALKGGGNAPRFGDADFNTAIDTQARAAGYDPDDLRRAIHFESGGIPSNTNSLGYTGIIQFGHGAAQDLGTTTDAIRGMTGAQQVPLAIRYIQGKLAGKLSPGQKPTFGDLYTAIAWPAGVGKPDSAVMYAADGSGTGGSPASRRAAYAANRVFDPHHLGYVTKGMMAQAAYGAGYAPQASGAPKGANGVTLGDPLYGDPATAPGYKAPAPLAVGNGDPLGDPARDPGDRQAKAILANNDAAAHQQRQIENLGTLPFDLASYEATILGGGRRVPLNQVSTLSSARQLTLGKEKAAAFVAYALGLTSTPGQEANGNLSAPLSAHERKVVQNIQDPKSAAFGQVRAILSAGGTSGAPMSPYDQARLGGYSPQASAVFQGDPSIGDASTAGLVTRALGRASSLGVARTFLSDQRPDSAVTPLEHGIGMVADVFLLGGAGKIGSMVADAAPVAALRGVVGGAASKLIPDVVSGAASKAGQTVVGQAVASGLRRTATSAVGRLGGKALAVLGENAAFQVLPALTQAADLNGQNGKGYWANLQDVGAASGSALLKTFNPMTLGDPNATAEEKQQTALNVGLFLFGAGAKGYDWAMRAAEERKLDPAIVQRLVDEGRRDGMRRAGVGAAVPPEPGPTATNFSALARTGGAVDASGVGPVGASDPLAGGLVAPDQNAGAPSYPHEPTPPALGANGLPIGQKNPVGEPAALVGETPSQAFLLPDGKPAIRDDADRSRLAAMVEEFGHEEGSRRYLADRMNPPEAPPPALVTGDEMTQGEHEALKTRVERLRQDRARLDAVPDLPEGARERFVRSFDPESLDPFADHPASDGEVASAHILLFGDAPERDAHGEITPAARDRIRDEIETDRESDYDRYHKNLEEAHADDRGDWDDLLYASGAKRRPAERGVIPGGPDEPRGRAKSSPDDVITARRDPKTGNWRYTNGKVPMVGMDQTTPAIARELIHFALTQESDHFFINRGEIRKFRSEGIKPNYLRLSEFIGKDVPDGAWDDADFDGWHRISLPKKMVADYVKARVQSREYAAQELASRLPDLTREEIENLVEYYARGGDAPPRDAGRDRSTADGGRPDAGPREGGGVADAAPVESPRQGRREALDAQIADLDDRIARARVRPDEPVSVLRPGDELPASRAADLVGPDGRPAKPVKATPAKPVQTSAADPAPSLIVPPSVEARSSEPAPEGRTTPAAPSDPPPSKEPAARSTEATKGGADPAPAAEPTPAAGPSARNADRDAAREDRGEEPLPAAESRTRDENQATVRKRLKRNPNAGDELAARLNERPRPISDAETTLLEESYQRQLTRAEAIQNELKTNDSDALRDEYSRLRDKMDANDRAMRAGGTEVARALSARRRRIVDYSKAETVLADARAQGLVLDPTTEKRIRDLSDEVAQGKARESALQAEVDALKADGAKGEAEAVVRRGQRGARRSREAIRADRDRAWGDFYKATSGQANFFGTFNAEAGKALRQVADLFIEEGVNSLADLVDKVRAHIESKGGVLLGDGQSADRAESGKMVLYERDLYAAIAGRFDDPTPPTLDVAQDMKAHVRTVARIVSRMHDVLDGTFPDRAPARVVNDQVRAMREALARLKRIRGYDDLPAADPAKVYGDRIQKALHDLAHGPEPEVAGPAAPDSPEVARLKERLADIRKRAKEKWGEDGETKVQNRVAAIERRIAAEETKLRQGYRDLSDAPRAKPIVPEAIEAARASLRDVRQRLKLDDRTAELERRIRDKDFAAVEAEDAKRADDRARQLAAKSEALKAAQQKRFEAERHVREAVEVAKAEAKRAQMHVAVKVAREVGGLFNGVFRTMQTTLDVSGPRQASKLLPYTYRTAPRNLARMFSSFLRDDVAHRVDFELHDTENGRANAALYKSSGLHFNELDGSDALSEIEKTFCSRLVGKLPLVKGSERSYATVLNLVRADAFDLMTRNAEATKGGRLTPEEYKSVAKAINILTGRGSGKFADGLGELGAVGFAPRFEWSKWQTAKGDPFKGASPAVRKEVGKAYGGFLSTGMTLMLLGQMAGAKVGWDPRDDNFGRIGFGPYEYDVWAGLTGPIRLVAQSLAGSIDRHGQRKAMSGYARANLVGKYFLMKAGPLPRAAYAAVDGKVNYQKASYGADLGYQGNFWTNLAGPLSLRGLVEGYQTDGVAGVVKASPDLVGVGTSIMSK